jgi:DnaJ like chaperone protein
MVGMFDNKYYKWASIIPGWIFGGVVGSVASFLLVQEIVAKKEEKMDFEIALLRICSMLIKSSGEVEKSEVNTVRRFFKTSYGFKRTNRIFNEVKKSPLRYYNLGQLIDVIKEQTIPTKYYSIIQLLYQIAVSGGSISVGEDDFIKNVGLELQFSSDRLEAIKSQFIKVKSKSKKYNQETLQNLSILGLKAGVTRKKVKNAYRILVKDFHPDKLSGMSQNIQDLAKEKFLLIQEAYEYLDKNYE